MAAITTPLSVPAIVAGLDAAACRFDIELLAECGSTNAELLARVATGAPSGKVIVAERQTAGRGRLGRDWISAPGDSLTFSLLWRFSDAAALSGLSLAVGVAVVRALEKVGVGEAALKWPNDVLLDDKKIGGILIEVQSASPSVAAVIGIGLNLRLPDAMPAELRAMAGALDGDADANALLAMLLAELLTMLDAFTASGFASARDAWLDRHAWNNRPVRVLAPNAVAVDGICAGVDVDGALLLETAGGVQRILSGDLSLRLA